MGKERGGEEEEEDKEASLILQLVNVKVSGGTALKREEDGSKKEEMETFTRDVWRRVRECEWRSITSI